MSKRDVAIIGCGDVAFRAYMPALADLAPLVNVVAVCDPDRARARDAAEWWGPWGRTPAAFRDVHEMLAAREFDGVFNLTPARLHYEVSLAALEARAHVYSEKPIATSLAEADQLLEVAEAAQRMLLCAPAVMAADRYQWLGELIDGGGIGAPVLASGQLANLGPAAWTEYTGDPASFYRRPVGPLVDQGVYLLHAITGLLGSARRVQAMAAVAISPRTVRGGASAGERFEVETYDQILVHLDLGESRLVQLLSAYTVPASRSPTLEIHGTAGSIAVFDPPPMTTAGGVHIFVERPEEELRGWIDNALHPANATASTDLIRRGASHFIACLRGEESPLLPGSHARHVLEIILGAEESLRCREVVEITSTL